MADSNSAGGSASPTKRGGSCAQPLSTLPSKVRRRIEIDLSGCWLWIGNVTQRGYGRFQVKDDQGAWRNKQAHRVVYELLVGDPGENLHHRPTCPKRCVNPEHLTPMTISAHVIEHNVRDTCKQGHPLAEAYTVHTFDGRTRRMCAQCARDNQKRINARKRVTEPRQRRHLTDEQRDDVRRRRLAGEPVKGIAERYGVSTGPIYDLTRDLAIPRRIATTTRPDRRLTDGTVRAIRTRAAAGATHRALASEHGVSPDLIGRIVARHLYRDVT